MRKDLFRRINESEAQLKTGKLYDEQALGIVVSLQILK